MIDRLTLGTALFGFCCVSSSLSAQDMPITQVLKPGADWEVVSEGHEFTEGPATDAKGRVYFSDVRANRIYRIELDGSVEDFARNTARTNGLMVGPDGRLYGCRMGDRQIVAYNADGTHDVLVDDVDSNDIVVASSGEIYWSDPKGERVWYRSTDGEHRVVARGFRPNGLILWPGETTLVVTDSDQPHLWTYRVEPDGSLAFPEKYYLPLQLPSGKEKPGSDGMTVDSDGRLYVATHAGLQMFDPTGRLGGTILKPQNKFMSNATFGGPGFKTLYVTCSDKVYRRDTKPTGAPYFLRSQK